MNSWRTGWCGNPSPHLVPEVWWVKKSFFLLITNIGNAVMNIPVAKSVSGGWSSLECIHNFAYIKGCSRRKGPWPSSTSQRFVIQKCYELLVKDRVLGHPGSVLEEGIGGAVLKVRSTRSHEASSQGGSGGILVTAAVHSYVVVHGSLFLGWVL